MGLKQKRVELLEHRVTTGLESMPLMRRWRLALVVLTVDDFIHVFDLPPEEVRLWVWCMGKSVKYNAVLRIEIGQYWL